MKLKSILLMIIILFIIGCTKKETSCNQLEQNLDNNIYNANDAEDFRIGWDHELIVGGILINSTNQNSEEGSKRYNYELEIKGKKKQGTLFLSTTKNNTIPYKIGNFYKFNLKQLKDHEKSPVTSGVFLDDELDQLTLMTC